LVIPLQHDAAVAARALVMSILGWIFLELLAALWAFKFVGAHDCETLSSEGERKETTWAYDETRRIAAKFSKYLDLSKL
jgi:hypothetical protein